MFHVYHSNQLDVLKILAAAVIKHDPLDDPFASEMVLVQSPGMAQWLQMELAQTFGIAANIEFPLPASFIWEMFVRVLPDIPVESAFSKASMGWKLMHRLPVMLEQEEFTSLRHYLHDDGDKRKLFQLSARVADLFDQYLVYRADWLNSWERGETIEGLGEAQRWQAALWRDLVSYTQALGQPEWHRANLYSRFIQTLEQAKSTPENLPKRVFICGISALPPVYLQALQALGRHIDIHLLFTNPCRDYWGDIQDYAFLAKLQSRQRRRHGADESRGLFRDAEQASALFNDAGEQQLTNPLLASWGKLGRDNLFLLSQMDSNDDIDAFVDVEPDNLLHCMQHDLLNLQDNAVIGLNAAELAHSDQKRCLDPADRSIAVQVCHSAQREVEVLQDHLLAMMEADPTLKARDIIVMWWRISTPTPRLFRLCSPTHLPIATCRLPFQIAVPVRRIRPLSRFFICWHCRTAVLFQRMYWRYWMFRRWPPTSPLMKAACAYCGAGSANRVCAGGWMMPVLKPCLFLSPGSTPGVLACSVCCWAMRWRATMETGRGFCLMTSRVVWQANWRAISQSCSPGLITGDSGWLNRGHWRPGCPCAGNC
ncbi:exodeoxyribonuclease V gamma subunit [Pantoea eucalypti]